MVPRGGSFNPTQWKRDGDMTQAEQGFRTHRFHELAALSIGEGPQLYLSRGMAKALAESLMRLAIDIDGRSFQESELGVVEYEEATP